MKKPMKQLYAILTVAMLSVVLCSHAQEQVQIRLVNGNGMEAVISNYGARLVSLTAHNWNGRLEPVVKGYTNKEEYLKDRTLGATLIYFGKNNEETLSGKMWELVSSDNQSVTLRYVTSQGENGLDGKLNATVTYTLSDQNALDVDYRVATTAETKLEVTNGICFNLSGEMHRSILKQHLWVDAVCSLVPYGSEAIVLGESGAGKSTLLNALLGHEALETGEVSESEIWRLSRVLDPKRGDLPMVRLKRW